VFNIISLIRRRGDIDHSAFLKAFAAVNARLYRATPSCRHYVPCPIDAEPPALPGMPSIDVHLDGFEKIGFTDEAAFRDWLQARTAAEIFAQMAGFTGAMALYAVEENVVRDTTASLPAGTAPLKRFVLVRRKAGTTHAEFTAHWRDVHAPLARKVPGGSCFYVRHRVLEEIPVPGIEPLWLDLDGFSETWYASEAELARGAASPEGQAVARDNLTFCGQSKRFFFSDAA
jgi:uncharacterized protein (TIGR02118 family)